jgi:hypothetical protein
LKNCEVDRDSGNKFPRWPTSSWPGPWAKRPTPIAGEITEREPYNGYLLFQGGIPEVEEFIRKFHK